MTPLRAALADALHALAGHSPSLQLDAELLLQRATGLDRTQLRVESARVLSSDQMALFDSLLRRRLRGEPMAYILGQRGFWSFDLQVSPAVLIPRPETELLVERALVHLSAANARVLDLGTGSGAIALAIATEHPQAQVTATDISSEALAVARQNSARLQRPVQFVESDWYRDLPELRFDLIVSNPPYIAVGDPHLDPAVLATEPTRALLAGPTGLEALQSIVAGAPEFLTPHGWLLLEHGWQQGAAVRDLLVAAGFDGVASHADLAGNERVTEGQWPH